MSLRNSVDVSASALRAQSLRMRVIAENLANQQSVSNTPGGDPYRRRVVTFEPILDGGVKSSDAPQQGVRVRGISTDKSAFQRVYQPGHPAADAQGYIMMPNVNSAIETADMRSAQRSYEANVNAIETARAMTMRTIDLLK
ncbi:flagellar basal body rod protein FlgC [Novosphingobium sp. M1R2S20]|uniref:Flagellar basal-body rod protein FlgC n=1 Tax=Novosphingobium rhizovicinum TaxID=3228928 RepID=A0ABV3R8V9_9SPHN